MKQLEFIFIILITIKFLTGCISSSYNSKASLSSINQLIVDDDPIHLITKDGTEYEIDIVTMDSISIDGEGNMKRKPSQDWEAFSGKIPIDSIDLVQISKGDFGKSFLIYFSAITLAIKYEWVFDGPDEPEFQLHYPSGRSCPFIYSWNGNKFILEAEAFGIAFGKALEIETRHILPSLSAEDSFVKIRIANERPETHYFNSVELHAIESDINTFPILDAENIPWPVNETVSPVKAKDHSDYDILSKIEQVDGDYWESDLSNTSVFSNFEDIIDLTFYQPDSISNGSLLIHSINTNFSNIVFQSIFSFLGDQSLAFMQAVENDQELINILKDWIVESSIKSFIWNGKEWEKIGMVYPEANEVPFSRLIRFKVPYIDRDQVKIRLTCLSDVWKIDAVQMDWGLAKPLQSQAVPLFLATGSDGKNKVSLLTNADDKYAILLPPEKIDLKFKVLPPVPGKKITYAMSARGYLYEWIQQKTDQNIFSMFTNLIQDSKIDYLKHLLKNKNIFLPPVYTDWKRYKSEMSGSF